MAAAAVLLCAAAVRRTASMDAASIGQLAFRLDDGFAINRWCDLSSEDFHTTADDVSTAAGTQHPACRTDISTIPSHWAAAQRGDVGGEGQAQSNMAMFGHFLLTIGTAGSHAYVRPQPLHGVCERGCRGGILLLLRWVRLGMWLPQHGLSVLLVLLRMMLMSWIKATDYAKGRDGPSEQPALRAAVRV